MVALICSYNALVLGVRLNQARYSSDVNILGDDGILPAIGTNRMIDSMLSSKQTIADVRINCLPLSRLMEGSSGADSAPSLSSWSISPDATVLSPDLRPGCWGNVLPLLGNEFDLKPVENKRTLLRLEKPGVLDLTN